MNFLNRLLGVRWLQHLIFWVLSVYAIGSYFSISNFLKFIDFYYALLFHIPLLALVYINLKFLIPRYLQKGHILIYGLLCAILIGLTYFLHNLTFDVLLPMMPTEYYMVSFTDPEVLITIFLIYLVISTLIKLSKSWYRVQELKRENLQLELETLKNQLNPHFLFNSLNSVYGLSLKKSDQTPTMILKLSNLLRYVLYEAKDETVPLEKEIQFIESYLDLQKARANVEENIQFVKKGGFEGYEIAPLLLVNIIENAFKHGADFNEDDNFIRISLSQNSGLLTFQCFNQKEPNADKTNEKEGVGLENVRKRLDLIYEDRARIDIEDRSNTFEVTIKIQLDK